MRKLDYTDEKLVEGLRRRDERIMLYFRKCTFSYVRSLSFVSGKQLYNPYDLFSNGLMVLFRNLDNPDFVLTCSLKYYFHSICKYKLINLLKTEQPGHDPVPEDIEDLDETDHPPDTMIGEEDTDEFRYEIVRKNLKKMMRSCQRVLNLQLQNYTNAQIASRMKRSYTAVAKLKTQCTKKLRGLIYNDPDYQDFSM